MSGIPRRRLGRTGLEVPGIGLGGAGVGGGFRPVPETIAIRTVQHAISLGIDYIDTSPAYRDSERRIGLALSGVQRDRFTLSTKTGTHPERHGDYSWDGTMWSVENSLRLLKTDYIDLLLVHDPNDMEPVFASRGALEALESLKEQRVIGFIGLGQRRHDWHIRAIRSGRFDVILTHGDYHPIRTTALDDGLLNEAKARDVGVLNGSPLAGGLLTGRDPAAMPDDVRQRYGERELAAAERLYAWCVDNGLSVPGVALQFCLCQPIIHCTLTGAETADELARNVEGARVPLPDSVWTDLESLHLTSGQVDTT